MLYEVITVITVLEELDEQALVRILTEPKNALIKQYTELFNYDNIELIIDEEAKKAIAGKALEQKTGARGLRSIIESILMNVMFEAPSDPEVSKITITSECVTEHAEPIIERVKKKSSKKVI